MAESESAIIQTAKGDTWEKWKLHKQHRGRRPRDFQWQRVDASSLWAVCVMLSRSKGCRNDLEVLELEVSWSWNVLVNHESSIQVSEMEHLGTQLDLLNSVSEFHGKKTWGMSSHFRPNSAT